LGQWKAPGDSSPFLAQRFDNGVFHVTVQDGPNRRTVASAEGDPDRLDEFQDLVAELSSTAPELLHSTRALSELKLFRRVGKKFNAFRERSFSQSLSQTSDSLAAAETSETQRLFDEFAYVHEIDQYAKKAGISTLRHGEKKLPDPKRDWVHMAYRIKAGREDNNAEAGPKRVGEIDVFANGELIAEVRGNIGYQLLEPPEDPSIYFKFGVYRDTMPGELNFHFDNFSQGKSIGDIS